MCGKYVYGSRTYPGVIIPTPTMYFCGQKSLKKITTSSCDLRTAPRSSSTRPWDKFLRSLALASPAVLAAPSSALLTSCNRILFCFRCVRFLSTTVVAMRLLRHAWWCHSKALSFHCFGCVGEVCKATRTPLLVDICFRAPDKPQLRNHPPRAVALTLILHTFVLFDPTSKKTLNDP